MDPNLNKFIDFHREDIKKGNILRAILDATSYLHMILGIDNMNQITTELALFKEKLNEEMING